MPTGASGAPRTARSISTVRLLTVRSVDPMRVRCPGPIAEHILLHLAGGGLGQSSELYGGRAFEVRQVFAAESNKLLRADAVSRLERDTASARRSLLLSAANTWRTSNALPP